MAKTEERIKEVRQLIWKRRKKKIKAILLILGIIILSALVLNTKRIIISIFWNMEIFKVKNVKIIPENARPFLTEAVDTENLRSLLFLDIDELNEVISKIREVERAYIKKEFPSTLQIEIVMRKPWIFIEREGKRIFIDREGKIIEPYENPSCFVRVTGIEITGESVMERDLWKLDILQEIERWYNYYNIQKYFKMDNITILKPTEIILNDTENKRRIILTGSDIEEQFRKLKLILGEVEKADTEFEYIDIRFKNPVAKYKTSPEKQ